MWSAIRILCSSHNRMSFVNLLPINQPVWVIPRCVLSPRDVTHGNGAKCSENEMNDLKRETWCESNLIFFFNKVWSLSLSSLLCFDLISNHAKRAKMSPLCWWIHFRHLQYHSGRACWSVLSSLRFINPSPLVKRQFFNRIRELIAQSICQQSCTFSEIVEDASSCDQLFLFSI